MFHCELVLLNKTKWLKHALKMIEANRNKNNEELLKDILTFDFELIYQIPKQPKPKPTYRLT